MTDLLDTHADGPQETTITPQSAEQETNLVPSVMAVEAHRINMADLIKQNTAYFDTTLPTEVAFWSHER